MNISRKVYLELNDLFTSTDVEFFSNPIFTIIYNTINNFYFHRTVFYNPIKLLMDTCSAFGVRIPLLSHSFLETVHLTCEGFLRFISQLRTTYCYTNVAYFPYIQTYICTYMYNGDRKNIYQKIITFTKANFLIES